MSQFSQNNKIAISTIAVFLASFSLMLFFLDDEGSQPGHGKTDVLHSQEKIIEETPEEAYRAHIEEEDLPILVTTADGSFKFASENFCQVLSLNCKRLKGYKLFDFVNSNDLTILVESYTHLLQETNKIEGIGPLRMIRKNRERFVILAAKPITDETGKVTEIVFSLKDITEQVQNLDSGEDETKSGDTDKNDRNWLKRLYPKIKEMDQGDGKLIVDKAV